MFHNRELEEATFEEFATARLLEDRPQSQGEQPTAANDTDMGIRLQWLATHHPVGFELETSPTVVNYDTIKHIN